MASYALTVGAQRQQLAAAPSWRTAMPQLRLWRRQCQVAGGASQSRRSAALARRRRTRASSPPVLSASAVEEAAAVEDPTTAFDWKLGLALAGCAFEAYNDVDTEGGSPSLKMKSLGGTEVTFVDQDFLRSKYAGVMEVTVKSASGLAAADWWPGAKSDPFVVLNIGDSAEATSVVTQELEPRWDETFHLFVSDPSTQALVLKVLDQDVGKADDLLGSAMRGLQDVVDGESHDVELPLRGGVKGGGGTVSLRLRFLPFDEVLAGEVSAPGMGGPVFGSPPAAITDSQWRTLQRDVLIAADAMFDPIAYVDNPGTDTQIWFFWNPATREVCVAFRGTEQVKWKDILTDLRLVPTSMDPEGLAEAALPFWRRTAAGAEQPPSLEAAVASLQAKRTELRGSVLGRLQGLLGQEQQQQQQRGADQAPAAQLGSEGGGGEAVWVHEGFLEAYSSVRPVVLRMLDTVLAGEEEQWTVYVTGHSLGAALSTLCTYDCAQRRWRTAQQPPRLVHYNYGSPRVGNKAFAEEFDRLVPNAWRVANSNDAVTLVPRMLGYCHIGHKAVLQPEGVLELSRNSSKGLGEGADMANVALAAAVNLPMLAEQLMAKQEEQEQGGTGMQDDTKAALLSAATAVASAAGALASSRQAGAAVAGEAGGEVDAVHSPAEVQRMLEDEMQAMQGLLDGSALNEHLEPLYLENLRAAIERLGRGEQ